jgi:hypothetical protein
LIGDCTSGSATARILAYDNGSDYWQIDITYTAGGGPQTVALGTLSAAGAAVSGAVAPGAVSIAAATPQAAVSAVALRAGNQATVEYSVNAASKDGAEYPDGSIILSTGSLGIIGNGEQKILAFLFDSVAIPHGAAVISATLNLRMVSFNSVSFLVRGEANATNFSTANYDFSSRTKTTASATHTESGTGESVRPVGSAAGMQAVLQEIVDSAGWTGAGQLGLYVIDNSSAGYAWVRMYESGIYAPTLTVVYLDDGGSQNIVTNTLTGASSAVTVTVSPGAVAPVMGTPAAAGAAVGLGAVTPGEVALLLDELTALLGHESATVATGAVALLMGTLTSASSTVTFTIANDLSQVTLNTVSLSGAAVSVSIVGENLPVELLALAASASAVGLDVVPGAVVLQFNTFNLIAQVMALGLGQDVLLATLTAVLAAESVGVGVSPMTVALASLGHLLAVEPLGIVPGATAVEVATVEALVEALALFVSSVGSPALIEMAELTGLLSPATVVVAPGGVSVLMQELAGALTLNDLIVFLLLGCALVGDRSRWTVDLHDAARWSATVGDRDGCG